MRNARACFFAWNVTNCFKKQSWNMRRHEWKMDWDVYMPAKDLVSLLWYGICSFWLRKQSKLKEMRTSFVLSLLSINISIMSTIMFGYFVYFMFLSYSLDFDGIVTWHVVRQNSVNRLDIARFLLYLRKQCFFLFTSLTVHIHRMTCVYEIVSKLMCIRFVFWH